MLLHLISLLCFLQNWCTRFFKRMNKNFTGSIWMNSNHFWSFNFTHNSFVDLSTFNKTRNFTKARNPLKQFFSNGEELYFSKAYRCFVFTPLLQELFQHLNFVILIKQHEDIKAMKYYCCWNTAISLHVVLVMGLKYKSYFQPFEKSNTKQLVCICFCFQPQL